MSIDLEPWDPLPVESLTPLLHGAAFRWWIAGGWAIDLHRRRVTRTHEDTDILVLRDDLPAVRRHLADWDLHLADPPGTLRPWDQEEPVADQIHDIWCRPDIEAPWCLQIMVDDAAAGVWRYRRDARITRPIEELAGPASDSTRRVLAPEIQLLAKSRNPRPKDEADFEVAFPALDQGRRRWLRDALQLVSPDHHWLAPLRGRGAR